LYKDNKKTWKDYWFRNC